MIAAVQSAVLDRARAVLGASVRHYEALASGRLPEAELDARLHKLPAVFVGFLGGPARATTTATIEAEFAVLVLCDSPREKARRDFAVPALEILVPALHRLLVPGAGTLALAAIENLYSPALDAKGLTLFGATYKIPLPLVPPADASARLAPFLTFHADYTLAADPGAAADTLTLQGDNQP